MRIEFVEKDLPEQQRVLILVLMETIDYGEMLQYVKELLLRGWVCYLFDC